MKRKLRTPFCRQDLPANLGDLLRRAREEGGWTRREIAARAGIASRTLARIEREAQRPVYTTLETLCEALGIDVGDLAPRWEQDAMDRPTDPYIAPGVAVRALRMARGMTLSELAGAANVSISSLSRFERGLSVSRRLTRLEGRAMLRKRDRDLVLDDALLASVFRIRDEADFREACADALAE